MEATLLYPRDLIAERAVFTPADHAQIALCRGDHNRLGLAYQMAFLRLTGRFPSQQPLELLPDVLAFVAGELALAPPVIEAYAQRQATVSAHQEQIRLHLGFRAFGPAEREGLSHFLREEALHLDHLAALVAQAEAFLRDHQVLLPALSTPPPARGRTARLDPPAGRDPDDGPLTTRPAGTPRCSPTCGG